MLLSVSKQTLPLIIRMDEEEFYFPPLSAVIDDDISLVEEDELLVSENEENDLTVYNGFSFNEET